MMALKIDNIFKSNEIIMNHNISSNKINELSFASDEWTIFRDAFEDCAQIRESFNLLYSPSVTPMYNDTTLAFLTILKWCHLSKKDYFRLAVLQAWNTSWQKNFSENVMQPFIFPLILGASALFLVNLMVIFHRISNVKNPIQVSIHNQKFVPATFTFLFWFCVTGIVWLILSLCDVIFSRGWQNKYTIKDFNIGCHLWAYVYHVVQQNPGWLVCALVVDRTIGEMKCRKRQKRSSALHYECGSLPLVSPHVLTRQNLRSLSCASNGADGRLQAYCRSRMNSNQPTYCSTAHTWRRVGMAKLGGKILVLIIFTVTGMVNSLVLWLYAVDPEHKQCIPSSKHNTILRISYLYGIQVSVAYRIKCMHVQCSSTSEYIGNIISLHWAYQVIFIISIFKIKLLASTKC